MRSYRESELVNVLFLGILLWNLLISASPLCADQISNCEDYIRDTPLLCEKQTLFRDANCKLSCGLCPQGKLPANT